MHRKISVREKDKCKREKVTEDWRERESERERSFVMCSVHLIWLGSSGQEDEMGEFCGTCEGEEKYVQNSGAETSR